jgi:hypothetical protein
MDGFRMCKKYTLADLTPDPANARRHSPRNVGVIVDALHEVGAARSIVIDEDGVILAGNATAEAAAEAGITRVEVVEADGQTVVAVRRRGLTPQQKARLALFDNRAAELADGWDTDVLRQMVADGVSLDGMWTEQESAALLAQSVQDDDGFVDPTYEGAGGKVRYTVTCPESSRDALRVALQGLTAEIAGMAFFE